MHRFDLSEVRSYKVTVHRRQTAAVAASAGGDAAADTFTLLDEGVHPVDVVKQLRLPPDVVIALREQWATMRGGFVVSAEEAKALGGIVYAKPAATAAVAVANVRARIDRLTKMRSGSAECVSCGQKTACICELCMIGTRGRLAAHGVRVERRNAEDGTEEVRVVAHMYWSEHMDDAGGVGALCSEWYRRDAVKRSPIADMVAGLERGSGGGAAS